MIEAWTHSGTGILWLRDLLPETIPVARVLTFVYDSSPSSFCGPGCADTIQKHAQTLVASLQADRSIEGCDYRPIIFICHGLGGVLVKKALAYSSSSTSSQVQHLYTIFVSTYAILFFGTPHDRVNSGSWLALETAPGLESSANKSGSSDESRRAFLEGDSTTLQVITEQFAPLMKKFRVYFFWEELPTKFGDYTRFLVEEDSAAPTMDNTERCGIDATHSDMVKFSRSDSSSYRTVIAALGRYCNDAPVVITRRWKKELETLARIRSIDASELAGPEFEVHLDRLFSQGRPNFSVPRNKHFYPPQETSLGFIGRQEVLTMLRKTLFEFGSDSSAKKQRRFVIHGMGGCGKTELCSKFAEDNKER